MSKMPKLDSIQAIEKHVLVPWREHIASVFQDQGAPREVAEVTAQSVCTFAVLNRCESMTVLCSTDDGAMKHEFRVVVIAPAPGGEK